MSLLTKDSKLVHLEIIKKGFHLKFCTLFGILNSSCSHLHHRLYVLEKYNFIIQKGSIFFKKENHFAPGQYFVKYFREQLCYS